MFEVEKLTEKQWLPHYSFQVTEHSAQKCVNFSSSGYGPYLLAANLSEL